MERRELLKNASVLALAAAHPVHVSGADTIRVGVIGCGGRGTEASVQALTADDGARLVAMADVVRELDGGVLREVSSRPRSSPVGQAVPA